MMIFLKKKGSFEKNNKPIKSKSDLIRFKPHYSRKLCEEEELYAFRPDRELISLKLGQRKLLFSELEYYTKILQPGEEALIVYAGSASGSHNPPLLELFNHCEFHFYDSNPFSAKLARFTNDFKKAEAFPLDNRYKKGSAENSKNLKLFHQYFTEKDAQNYIPSKRSKKLLFLSDIRTSGLEDGVESDLQLQQQWCDIIKPDHAMLKMRLRWIPGKTLYYSGKLYTQPRVGPKSTELRLWTNCKDKIEYDNDTYNNQCYFFQKYHRNAFHDFSTIIKEKKTDMPEIKQLKLKLKTEIKTLHDKIKGLCHCNDCWSEIKIITKFLLKFRTGHTIIEFFNYLDGPNALDIPPHNLLTSESDINKRIALLEKKTIEYNREYKEGRVL